MPKIEPFDKYYQKYENWFEKYKFVYLSELEAIRNYIPHKQDGIEIGIGTGRFAKPLGIEEGVEPSYNIGKIAKGRGIKVYSGTAEELPLNNNSYDFVLMVTTLCFLDDVEKSFSEIYRILKEHGRFIIGFVDKDSPIGKKYFESKNEITFYKYADFYSTDDVLRLLKKFNFKDVDILQTIFGNPEDIKDIQEFKRGHGEGVFVVVVSEKQGDIQ